MKARFILFLASVFLIGGNVYAQKIIWSEDFTYYAQQNFSYPWATSGSGIPWACDYGYLIGSVCAPYTGNDTKMAGVACPMLSRDLHPVCNKVFKSEPDPMLISPVISLIGQQHAALRYDSYFLGMALNGKHESARLEVSTDSGLSWTFVQNAPVLPVGAHMATAYADLSAFAGQKIRLGFRYSDSGEHMNGWMIDNLAVYVPSDRDIALEHVYPEDTLLGYRAVPANVTLTGVVRNMGYLPVTSYTIQYTDGKNGIQTHNVTGVNIAPFDTGVFVHAVPYTISSQGRYGLKSWATIAGDTLHKNDTVRSLLHGAEFMPQKYLVVEEGTGTWNIQAPRGIVYMHALDAYDAQPTRISVHSADVMDQRVYADYLFFMNQNYTPYFLFDRRGPVRPEAFFSSYDVQKEYFGFADISLAARASAGKIFVDANINFAIDLDGNYRLALVLTEDGVKGTDSGYAQANSWAGGLIGPMGGFENKPDPVPASDMSYDYVARSIIPTPNGLVCLPPDIMANHLYTYTFQTGYSAAWNLRNMKANVLLIREKDSSILNSKSISLSRLAVEGAAVQYANLKVFPNPAHTDATLRFAIPEATTVGLSVTDITGRTAYQYPDCMLPAGTHDLNFSTSGWAPGVYFVTVRTKTAQETVKLSVLH